LRLFSFGGYGLALAALALVVFGAYDSYPLFTLKLWKVEFSPINPAFFSDAQDSQALLKRG